MSINELKKRIILLLEKIEDIDHLVAIYTFAKYYKNEEVEKD